MIVDFWKAKFNFNLTQQMMVKLFEHNHLSSLQYLI